MKEKPIKVLQMISSLNYGGSQAMVVNLCRAMSNSNIHCDFIVDHPEYDGMKDIVEELGSRIYTMPAFTMVNLSQVKKAWNDFFSEHPEYSILHSHSRSYASIYIPIAKKHDLITIIHSHNTSNGKGFKARIKDLMQIPLRYQADYYFACSKNAGEWLFGKKIVNGNRFHVLNNAIETEKYVFNESIRNDYRKQFGIEDERVFIQVGRFDEQKNHNFTLELFRRYLSIESNSKLFIVGNGVLKKKILAKICELGIEKNVSILEYRNDVCNLLQMSDYFLMPSFFEGLSVAAIEAQASGIKCLCSDKCNKDVDVTGLCEFLPLDYDLWIKKMSDDYIRSNRKQDIITAGFDVKTTAKWLEDFYERITE